MQRVVLADGSHQGFRVVEESLLLWVNQHRTPFLDAFMHGVSRQDVWVVIVLLLLLRAWWQRKYLGLLLGCLVAIGFTDFVVFQALKPLLARLRPCYQVDFLTLFENRCGGWWGLPSNHAANGMAVATYTLARGLPRCGWMAFMCALCVGYSRVYAGVHFPADVFLGFATGGLFGAVIGRLFEKFDTHFRSQLI